MKNHLSIHFFRKVLLLGFLPVSLLVIEACAPSSSYQVDGSADTIVRPEKNDPRYYFLRSELALSTGKSGEGDYSEALRMLKKAEKYSNTPSVTIQERLAELYLRKEQYEKALEALSKLNSTQLNNANVIKLQAGILSTMGRRDEAIAAYQKLQKLSPPDSEEPYLLLAGIYLQKNEKSNAENVLLDLVQKNPKSFIGRYYLARLYASEKRFADAEQQYKEAVKVNDKLERVRVELIKVFMVQGKKDEAIAYSKESLEELPMAAEIRSLLGELLIGSNKIEEAIAQFETASAQVGDPSELQLRVALLKIRQRKYRSAETDLTLIVSKNPENYTARYYLASVIASQERIDEAVEELDKIPHTSEMYIKARGYGAFLLRSSAEYKKAKEFLEEGLKHKSKSIELLSFLASVHNDLKDDDARIETYERIVAISPDDTEHLFTLGVAVDESGDHKRGRSIMEQILELNPEHANALNFLSYSLAEASSELSRAKELIEKALTIEPQNAYFLDTLGWVLFQQGDYQGAVTALEKTYSIVNDDPVMIDHLGQAYAKIGRIFEAKKKYLEALSILKAQDKKDEKLESEIKLRLKELE